MEAIKKHLKKTFTSYQLELLRYLYLCITYEGSKFLILLIFFSFFHLGVEFCMEVLFLLALRNFFGGLHFNHYISCFAFTLAFSSTGIALSHLAILDNFSSNETCYFYLQTTTICHAGEHLPLLRHVRTFRLFCIFSYDTNFPI